MLYCISNGCFKIEYRWSSGGGGGTVVVVVDERKLQHMSKFIEHRAISHESTLV